MQKITRPPRTFLIGKFWWATISSRSMKLRCEVESVAPDVQREVIREFLEFCEEVKRGEMARLP